MKEEKCFICKSNLKGHAVLGRECDDIYYKNKMKDMKKESATKSK